MKIISIANQKGGCGKTTTAINLVSALAGNGRRTLLIDMDPQSHATLGLNRDDQNSLYNVISRITPRKLGIRDIIQRVEKNFDIVPSNVLVGTLEQELADEIGREMKMAEIVDSLRPDYDYIVIDCPPSLGFLTVNAIRASDEVIIPVETSRFSMQGVEHIMDIINLIRDRLNHHVISRVLITMFDSRLRHSFSMLAKMKSEFGEKILGTIIHVNVKLKESAAEGSPVINYDKYCRGAKDYFSLAKELIAIEEGRSGAAETAEFSQKMKDVIKKESESLVYTTFSLLAPAAQSVYLAGSFNDWSLNDGGRMSKSDDGRWMIRLPLSSGQYQYQFVVDGRWQPDPENASNVSNGFGDMNSVIKVGANG
ncbi:MAG: AAA family ATPase [Candidatus Omnitrophica bacterium]|nr:AAA family ATPase [Candidatus Omnitrophota bacterium]